MLTRRSFLASVAGSVVARHLVLQEGDDGVKVEKNLQTPQPPPVTFHFGDLVVMGGDESQLRINNPFTRCRVTQRFQFARSTDVYAKKLVGPKAVFDEIVERYGNVLRAKDNPPLVVKMGDKVLCTLEYALFQQLGWAVTANDMVVVEDVALCGRWKELHDAIDAYCEATRKETEFMNKVLEKTAGKGDDFVDDYSDFDAREMIADE